MSAYRSALEVYTREQLPQAWAMTQNNLGIALSGPGGSDRGAKRRGASGRGGERLPKRLGSLHARAAAAGLGQTQNNLGIALRDQAARTEGTKGAELLAEAVSAYRSALEVYTREQLPQDWATTQNNLGIALSSPGGSDGGAKGRGASGPGGERLPKRLGGQHARAAAAGLGRDPEQPRGRALGPGGSDRGDERRGASGPGGDAYRSALEVHTREQLPQDWATTQNNLGRALSDQAARTEGPKGAELLAEAVSAYRSALEVRTREQLPQDWAHDPEQPG